MVTLRSLGLPLHREVRLKNTWLSQAAWQRCSNRLTTILQDYSDGCAPFGGLRR